MPLGNKRSDNFTPRAQEFIIINNVNDYSKDTKVL